jgi:hypothetical protein
MVLEEQRENLPNSTALLNGRDRGGGHYVFRVRDRHRKAET